jgi:hypothetical protein
MGGKLLISGGPCWNRTSDPLIKSQNSSLAQKYSLACSRVWTDFPPLAGNQAILSSCFGNLALQRIASRVKSLKILARPERFELPTTWFVACRPKHRNPVCLKSKHLPSSPIEMVRT